MKKIDRIITIDGPACSGKGTLATLLAKHLNGLHLDSGLLYRALGYVMQQQQLKEDSLIDITLALDQLFFEVKDCDLVVIWNNTVINSLLRDEEVSRIASVVASHPKTREALLPIQFELAQMTPTIVADGRDMGTVVFPQADYKFFLIAPVDIRAQRRFEEKYLYDPTLTYELVLEKLKERDDRDSARSISPLKKAEDAVVIETGRHTIDECLALILNSMWQN